MQDHLFPRPLAQRLPRRRGDPGRARPREGDVLKRILITGMSGTGKSSVIQRLSALGHRAVDADSPEWSEWASMPSPGAFPDVPPELDWVWREDRMRRLLDEDDDGALFVSGTASNQGRFYDRFDHIVLLSAPTDVLLQRVATRTTNQYGKSPEERARIVEHVRTVQPLLRAGADLEIDTATHSLNEVLAILIALSGKA